MGIGPRCKCGSPATFNGDSECERCYREHRPLFSEAEKAHEWVPCDPVMLPFTNRGRTIRAADIHHALVPVLPINHEDDAEVERLVEGVAAAFSHEDAVRYVGEFRSQAYIAGRDDERKLIRADVEALTEAWKRGDNVEVSRLLVKLRDG